MFKRFFVFVIAVCLIAFLTPVITTDLGLSDGIAIAKGHSNGHDKGGGKGHHDRGRGSKGKGRGHGYGYGHHNGGGDCGIPEEPTEPNEPNEQKEPNTPVEISTEPTGDPDPQMGYDGIPSMFSAQAVGPDCTLVDWWNNGLECPSK